MTCCWWQNARRRDSTPCFLASPSSDSKSPVQEPKPLAPARFGKADDCGCLVLKSGAAERLFFPQRGPWAVQTLLRLGLLGMLTVFTLIVRLMQNKQSIEVRARN